MVATLWPARPCSQDRQRGRGWPGIAVDGHGGAARTCESQWLLGVFENLHCRQCLPLGREAPQAPEAPEAPKIAGRWGRWGRWKQNMKSFSVKSIAVVSSYFSSTIIICAIVTSWIIYIYYIYFIYIYIYIYLIYMCVYIYIHIHIKGWSSIHSQGFT